MRPPGVAAVVRSYRNARAASRACSNAEQESRRDEAHPAGTGKLASSTVTEIIASPPGTSLRDAGRAAATAAERQAIVAALGASGGNKSRAAKALATDYKTLHVKMKQMGISARDFRDA